ncbi:Na(+)/H(+) antiporter subunit B [Pleomorphochaeta sp. DL1XJH-081]|jgi:uncharacterized MnhB-related membrane protein|uniref:Na(+)/H(+) antiporter subunit B n=1 Tax=Pleomorphochaeta sp. DL1XJH-081 TaxID=3409690 RepID=UPI003BB56EB6
MTTLLLVLIIVLAVCTLTMNDLLHGVIAMSAISLLSAIIFYLMHAPDVAITEAAVGAGVSTVIFVWALRHSQRSDHGEK